MATRLQLRKGTTAEHSTFVGADGEVTVDTTKKALVLHDGFTAGGKTLPTLDASGKVPVAQLPESTLSDKGVVQLDNTLTSTSTSKALTAAQGKLLNDRAFCVGQTYVDVSSSRRNGTTYTNTTGKAILVMFKKNATSASIVITARVDGKDVGGCSTLETNTITFVVPDGSSYSVNWGVGVTYTWVELR